MNELNPLSLRDNEVIIENVINNFSIIYSIRFILENKNRKQNWNKICEELPVVVLPKCVDDEFIKDLYDIFIGTYCPKRFEMSYNRIQEAINMMFLMDTKH